ncbi:MAG: hypothetical protein WCZ48_06595 [Bacillota bacterium]|jgi:hypothetical protein|nr:hypothetical protein [Bacillota bacterium]NLH87874.1 hypothetical protein [Bacillota bacterium]
MRYDDSLENKNRIKPHDSTSFEEDATCREDIAIIEALHSGIKANPEFRARLKQQFMAEARADAARRGSSAPENKVAASERARSERKNNVRPLYVRLAAVAAAAAILIISGFATDWFRPTPPEGQPVAEAPTSRSAALTEEGSGEMDYGEGNIQGKLAGTSDVRAMGFAPQADDSIPVVEVRVKSALTDDSALEIEDIARQAGGTADLDDAEVHLSIPSEVLDHVLVSLDEKLKVVVVSRPVEINTETTCITLYFSAD